MNLKTRLDALTMETAVLGGAILGSGGGGKLEDGLYLGEMATVEGGAALIDTTALPAQTNLAVVVSFHTSAIDTRQIQPRQTHHAIENLQAKLGTPLDGLLNGGMGAVDSIIGWEISGFTGLPLLDAGIPAIYYPQPLRNLLHLWLETAVSQTFTLSLSGSSGQGRGQREYLWQGSPLELGLFLDQLPAADIQSYAAAVGPLPLSELAKTGLQTSVSQTLQIGQLVVSMDKADGEATVAALQRALPWQFSTLATVTHIDWFGEGRDAYGLFELRDIDNRLLNLKYSRRYMELLLDGRRLAAFPDQIITLGILGTPLSGEEVFIGQDLYLIVGPDSSK